MISAECVILPLLTKLKPFSLFFYNPFPLFFSRNSCTHVDPFTFYSNSWPWLSMHVNVATQPVQFFFPSILLFAFSCHFKTPLLLSRAVYFLAEHTISVKTVRILITKLNFRNKFSQIIGYDLLLSIAKTAKMPTLSTYCEVRSDFGFSIPSIRYK